MDNTDLPEGIRGFSPWEAEHVVLGYVCAVCWSTLLSLKISGDRLYIVVCPEHGNIELCGRITKNTVSIEIDRGYRKYHEVIRNLPDLWGHLAQSGFDRKGSVRISRDYVCSKCGGPIYPTMIEGQRDLVTLSCPQHGDINISGYTKKELYKHEPNFRFNKSA